MMCSISPFEVKTRSWCSIRVYRVLLNSFDKTRCAASLVLWCCVLHLLGNPLGWQFLGPVGPANQRGISCPRNRSNATRSSAFFIALVLVLLLMPDFAFAQGLTKVDQIPDAFQETVKGMSEQLAKIARNLMMALLVIELIWALGKTVMEGEDFGSLMGIFIKRILLAGFFLALVDGIPTASGNIGFGSFIIQSAEALTKETTGTESLKPSNIFYQMFDAGRNIYKNSSGLGGTVTAAITWFILIVLGAVIAGLMITAYIEIYVIFTVGILALGFGAWSVTQQFTTNFLFAAVGKIFKLFVMLLMGAIIATQLKDFGPLDGVEDGIIAIGISVIFVMLMSTIPGAVEQMISGIPSSSSDGAVKGAATGTARTGASVATSPVRAAGRGLGKMAQNKARATARRAGGALASTIRSLKK